MSVSYGTYTASGGGGGDGGILRRNTSGSSAAARAASCSRTRRLMSMAWSAGRGSRSTRPRHPLRRLPSAGGTPPPLRRADADTGGFRGRPCRPGRRGAGPDPGRPAAPGGLVPGPEIHAPLRAPQGVPEDLAGALVEHHPAHLRYVDQDQAHASHGRPGPGPGAPPPRAGVPRLAARETDHSSGPVRRNARFVVRVSCPRRSTASADQWR